MSLDYFKYSIFGLKVETNFEITFLKKLNKNYKSQLKVTLDRQFKEPNNLYSLGTVFTRNYIYYIDKHKNIFRISQNDTIDIKKHNNKKEKDIALSLLGIPIGYFFFLKGMFVSHASIITRERNAISFLGQTSSGKSSLSNYLLSKNFKFCSEDLSLIKRNHIIDRSSNWIKLSKEMIRDSMENFSDSRPIPGDRRNREFCILKDSLVFTGTSKLKLCYVPVWGNELKISRLDINEAFKFLLVNSYRPKNYKNKSKLEEVALKNITNLISNVPCFKFSRKKDMSHFAKSNNFLLGHIKENLHSNI